MMRKEEYIDESRSEGAIRLEASMMKHRPLDEQQRAFAEPCDTDEQVVLDVGGVDVEDIRMETIR